MIGFALLLALAGQSVSEKTPAPMKCEIGPIDRQIGGNAWIVYGCDDEQSFIVVTKKENPASPFYFLVHRHAGKVAISGEGNGNKQASSAANEDLKALGPAGLAELNDAVRQAVRAR